MVHRPSPRTIVLDTGVDIHRPMEEVFDYCIDLGHETEWDPHIRRVEGLTPGRPRLGSRYVAEFHDGHRMIVRHDAVDRPCAWRSSGMSDRLTATLSTELTARGEVTRLREHLEIEPRGALRYAGPLLRPLLARRERRNLAALKRALEHHRPQPVSTAPSPTPEPADVSATMA
jgi:hypothetical protein